jgi:flavodoxin
MKVGVIYFSLTGNTKRISEMLRVGDTELIEVRSALRILSLLGLVKHPKFEHVRYDLLVVGCPVWYENPAQPIIKALRRMDFHGKQVNIFVTYALRMGRGLKELSNEVKASNGSVGRMMAFDVSKEIDENEVMKLLSP